MSDTRDKIEHALRKARRDARSHGHDWDVADALEAVIGVLDLPAHTYVEEQWRVGKVRWPHGFAANQHAKKVGAVLTRRRIRVETHIIEDWKEVEPK